MTEHTCSVEGCEKKYEARGYCHTHYAYWRRTGLDPSTARQYMARGMPCTVDGCDVLAHARSLCQFHYARERNGLPMDNERRRAVRRAPCLVDDCDTPSNAKGYCSKHYNRWRKYGDPLVYNGQIPENGRGKWNRTEQSRFYKFGITPEEFEGLFASQDGKCLGCLTTEPDGVGWCLDHCHETGVVRAIMCHRCNTSLGLCNEDPDTLHRLANLAARFARERLRLVASS